MFWLLKYCKNFSSNDTTKTKNVNFFKYINQLVSYHTYSADSYFYFKIVTSGDFSRIDFVKVIGVALNGKVSVIILFLCFQNIQVLV